MTDPNRSELTAAARIVGALAHELNNPLQGVLSLLAIESRESSTNGHLQKKLRLLNEGISRIAKAVESFSVVYENLPRTPDSVTHEDFIHHIENVVNVKKINAVIDVETLSHSIIYCYIPEQIKLVFDIIDTSRMENDSLHVRISEISDALHASFEIVCNKVESMDDWQALNMSAELSGLPILLQEITRITGGTLQCKYDQYRLRGIKLILPFV